MKKQTAVDWLIEQYIKVGGISKSMAERAKQMEKEQIIDFAIKTRYVDDIKQYYNKTFESK